MRDIQLERQPIYMRDDFSDEDRQHILAKSRGLCCHCGKRIEFGGKATVDHFIPLHKGGSNRDINMIALCQDCNKKKSDHIIEPYGYLPYLKEEEFNKLDGYFESFILSFNYVDRRNILACDEYSVYIVPNIGGNYRRKRKNIKKNVEPRYSDEVGKIAYTLSRMLTEDILDVQRYFAEYLKKYNAFKSEDEVRKDIDFWNKFGMIYLVRDMNREIKLIVPITMGRQPSDEEGRERYGISMFAFSKYATDSAVALVYGVAKQLPRFFLYEHKENVISASLTMLKDDPASKAIIVGTEVDDESNMWRKGLFWIGKPNGEETKQIEESNEFFKQFLPTMEELDDYFDQGENATCSFLAKAIYPGYKHHDHADEARHNVEAMVEEVRKQMREQVVA